VAAQRERERRAKRARHLVVERVGGATATPAGRRRRPRLPARALPRRRRDVVGVGEGGVGGRAQLRAPRGRIARAVRRLAAETLE